MVGVSLNLHSIVSAYFIIKTDYNEKLGLTAQNQNYDTFQAQQQEQPQKEEI